MADPTFQDVNPAVVASLIAAHGKAGGPAYLSTDAAGNPIGIAGANGPVLKTGARRLKTALVCGDSITAYAEVSLSLNTVTDNGDGTVTAYRSSGHGLNVGQPVRVFAAPTPNMNVMEGAVIAVIDANNFKYSTAGRTHGVVSQNLNNTVASVVMPYRRSARGWFGWMETFLGESFQTTWCAVPGATASDISTLLDATPMAEVADLGTLCIGMNNIYAKSQAFAAAQAEIKALVDKMRAKCGLMVILTVPPKSSSDAAVWTAAKQQVHNKLNRWIFQYAQQVGAVCIQTSATTQNNTTYANPAATYAEADPAFLHDLTHPSMRGAMALGKAVAAAVSPFMGSAGWKAAHPSLIGSDTGNLLTGADFAAGTSGIANGWLIDTITGLSVTPTLEARTVATDGDACGNNQRIDLAYGTATGTPSPRFRKNGIQGLLTAGQIVQLRIPFLVTGAVGLIGLEAALFGSIGSGFWQVYSQNVDGNTKAAPGSISGVLITPPAVVPAGLTNLDVWIRPTINSAQATPLTMKVWQPELLVIG